MKYSDLSSMPLILFSLFLSACSQTIKPSETSSTEPYYSVSQSTQSVVLNADPETKRQIIAADLAAANKMLVNQGKLQRQTIVITPFTPFGQQVAQRFRQQLTNLGMAEANITVLPIASTATGDLEILSIAQQITLANCDIADMDRLSRNPYYALNNLGCANATNLARMVSNPDHLVRPLLLDPAQAAVTEEAISRYQKRETEELIDFDLSNN